MRDQLKLKVRHENSLSGAEKRRKRKGGNPEGGPGKKGAGMRPGTPRQRRGYLEKP
jgi:hypothetical protein